MELTYLLLLATCAAATPAAKNIRRDYSVAIPSCGTSFTAYPTASTSGSVTCPSTAASPSSNAHLRIEGDDAEGTIFEGCVVAGPREITTASGGTHACDGTNNGANPAPGTVPTAQLDAAAQAAGFGYDAAYYASLDDFFVTRIGASTQTATQFWGTLVNGQFTPSGGCQFQVCNGDETLFAFDAFGKDVFLRLDPGFAVAVAGSGAVTVTVTNAMDGAPQAGVSVAGQVTDVLGRATVPVPDVPGCYRLKATRSGALRSNTFYLTVVDHFANSGDY